MIFPEYFRKGDTIAVTALSRGMEEELEIKRFNSARKALEQRGFHVRFTENVFAGNDRFGRSSPAKEKARQLNELIADPQVKGIYSAAGGNFLAEMLPFVDIDAFRENPKWIQGFSDNTSILHYLTTKADVATAYGANFGDFGMRPWDRSVETGLSILEGGTKTQTSFDTFQDGFRERLTGLEGYASDGKVEWKAVCKADTAGGISMEGRLIGGCLDVLINIAGTPYDGTGEFIEKYKEDGILWFFESFDLHFEHMMEALWKMKEMGWFEHVSGIVFGRPLFYRELSHDGSPLPTYEEVIRERLDCLNVPVITDADIGHKGPQFIMITGALARIECAGGKGKMTYLS
ncbi:MAG: S66 family peptidase [Lachnospiraceae bacterium]|jgi:muramoyltetrapeptide carboxypeptidase